MSWQVVATNWQRAKRPRNKRDYRALTHSANLSVIIFQSLIKIAGCFTIGKTIMRDVVEPSGFEIIADLAAVNPIFGRMHTENFAKEFKRSFAVALEISQNFAHVEVSFRTEAASIEQDVAGNGNTCDRTANIDVWKIE